MTVATDGRVVIVGTGIAGATAAETLRKNGFTGPIAVVGDDPSPPYRRPMVSKELLSGAVGTRQALLRPAEFWSDESIDLHTATSVRELDAEAARIELDAGRRLDYDALILATGGRPRRLDPMLAHGHYLRHLHDVAPVRATLEQVEPAGRVPSVVIVGGGLVGMEAAAAARSAGAEVTVLEAGERILERVLPEPISAASERMHRDRGVAVHTGVRLVDVTVAGDRTTLTAADGIEWTADAVIVAVGMEPNVELAEQAGLAVADGVVVDEYCATSVSGVYAAGDVARFPNRILGGTERVEHWNHARSHGAATARSVLGGDEPYEDVPWCWTNQFGRNLQISGWPGRGTELIVRGDLDSDTFLALCLAQDRLVGAIGVGRPREVRAAGVLIEHAPLLPRALMAGDDLDLVAIAAAPERFGAAQAPAVCVNSVPPDGNGSSRGDIARHGSSA